MSAWAAAMRRAMQEGSDGLAAKTLSVRSGNRMTRSSPRYAATCCANATAASSPATTASVVWGLWANRAAVKNGRAELATPSVASSPASSLPQNASRHPERSSANVSESMSTVRSPFLQTQKSRVSGGYADAAPR